MKTQENLIPVLALATLFACHSLKVAKKEGRISNPVVLRVKLEVVSRPGVMFSNCNATRHDALLSNRPDGIRFDLVKAKNCFEVPQLLRHYYQAEILVPSPLPPPSHLLPNSESQPGTQDALGFVCPVVHDTKAA